MDAEIKVATFAAGCFWGVEARFRAKNGVVDAEVGYTGGFTKNPTYKEVCSDSTGHAEAVLVRYNPSVVSYDELLELFFSMHNPTQLNRQGPDFGSQYRTAIFYHDDMQKESAEALIETYSKERRFRDPIVTQVVPATTFYRAEEYHQRYLEKSGRVGACH